MTDTTFITGTTIIEADWANDVNRNTYSAANKAASVLSQPALGLKIFVGGTDGGWFKAVVGAAPGTYADNGGIYCGTQFIPTGGDGSIAWVRADLTVITPAMFGTVGDGVADDTAETAAFFAYVGADGIGFMDGAFELTSLITQAFTNCKIYGVPGKTKITGSFGYSLIEMLSSNDVVFEDIIFETTYVNAADDPLYGIIYSGKINSSVQPVLDDITFSRCKFTAPNCGANGIGFYPRNAIGDTLGFCRNLTIDHCIFDDIGRIACVLMNRGTASDKYDAFRGLRFTNNIGDNLGQTSVYGFLVTLDGFGSDFVIDNNHVRDVLDIGIENTGWIDGSITANTFTDFQRVYKPISCSAITSGPMSGLSIKDNKTIGAALGQVTLIDVNDSVISGNTFEGASGKQALYLRDCDSNKITENNLIANHTTVMTVETFSAGSTNNDINNNTLDNSATTNNQLLLFTGSGTSNNAAVGNTFKKGAGGVYASESVSAANNYLQDSRVDGTNGLVLNFSAPNFASDADMTLTIDQYSAEFIKINDSGVVLTTTRSVFFPILRKRYSVWNNTAQILKIVHAGRALPTLAAGATATYYTDGLDLVLL